MGRGAGTPRTTTVLGAFLNLEVQNWGHDKHKHPAYGEGKMTAGER